MDEEQASETKSEPSFRSSSPSPQRSLDSASSAMGASLDTADGLLTERDAYRLFGHLLEDKELRRARQDGRLGFLRRKRTIFYRRTELEGFVTGQLDKDYVAPCLTTNPAHGATPPRSAPAPSAGERRAERGLTPEILKRSIEIMRWPED